MISTASAALNAWPAGLPASSQPASVSAEQASTAGTNTAQIRSASRWMPALPAWACSTIVIRWASWVSAPTLSARTTRRPVSAIVPPVTASPGAASTGTDSPGHRAAVHRGLAGQDLAVGGDPLSGPDHEPLAGPQPGGRDPLLGSVVVQHADVPGAGRGQLPHGLPGGAPGPGLVEPAGQQERGHRGGHLEVDAAAGAVQQVLQAAQPAPAAVQHEHGVRRPAAGGQDAQRHQRVHRRGQVPGLPQRGGVERPRRPGRHRHGQRDQQPLPAGEPGPREDRQHQRGVGERDEEHQRQRQPAAQPPHRGLVGRLRPALGSAGRASSAV